MKYLLLILSGCCCIFFSCSKSETTEQNQFTLPIPVTGKSYTADEITAFKQLTLYSTSTSNGIIAKLPNRVSIYLVDTTYPHLTRELDSIISEINSLLDTNLVISRTSDRLASSIQVYLTDRNTYLQNEPSALSSLQNSNYTGYTRIDWNNQGLIYHGSVFVDMARTGNDTLQHRYLIHHEMMHVLGFIGHVSLPQFYTVMFSYTLTPLITDYTNFDKKLIQLLYNPAIKAGMKEATFDLTVTNL